MKAYTDIEQSKVLAEILPLESADMYYCFGMDINTKKWDYDIVPTIIEASNPTDTDDIPCWSLAALLEEIPSTIVNIVGEDLKLHINKDNLQYYLFYENEYTGDMFEIETELYDDMIDSCCELILKLHELNLL